MLRLLRGWASNGPDCGPGPRNTHFNDRARALCQAETEGFTRMILFTTDRKPHRRNYCSHFIDEKTRLRGRVARSNSRIGTGSVRLEARPKSRLTLRQSAQGTLTGRLSPGWGWDPPRTGRGEHTVGPAPTAAGLAAELRVRGSGQPCPGASTGGWAPQVTWVQLPAPIVLRTVLAAVGSCPPWPFPVSPITSLS